MKSNLQLSEKPFTTQLKYPALFMGEKSITNSKVLFLIIFPIVNTNV